MNILIKTAFTCFQIQVCTRYYLKAERTDWDNKGVAFKLL